MNLGMITARFNEQLTSTMQTIAREQAKQLTISLTERTVPGVLDMPLIAQALLKDDTIQGVFVLGVVKKGDTDHDQIVAHQAVRALVDLSLRYNKPVSFGIIGPNVTLAQAQARVENYAQHAVTTCKELVDQL